MLHQIFVILSLAAGGGQGQDEGSGAASMTEETETAQLVAEDQTPTGKFLTATEVKPILNMTRANWVAERDYNGQDLLYVTHFLAWRCGLLKLEYGVNGEGLKEWDLPPCYITEAAPASIKTEDGLPYISLPKGSVKTVEIRLTYDDLSVEEAQFNRNGIEIN